MKALVIAMLLALALVPATAAHDAGPCGDSGEPGNSGYAQHHVRPVAQDGDAGAVDHDGDGAAHTPRLAPGLQRLHGVAGAGPRRG